MSQPKFTPGPYKFTHDHQSRCFEIETVDQSAGDYRHFTNNMPMLGAGLRANCGCSEEQLAVARLFAAAPALYEALARFIEASREQEPTALASRVDRARQYAEEALALVESEAVNAN